MAQGYSRAVTSGRIWLRDPICCRTACVGLTRWRTAVSVVGSRRRYKTDGAHERACDHGNLTTDDLSITALDDHHSGFEETSLGFIRNVRLASSGALAANANRSDSSVASGSHVTEVTLSSLAAQHATSERATQDPRRPTTRRSASLRARRAGVLGRAGPRLPDPLSSAFAQVGRDGGVRCELPLKCQRTDQGPLWSQPCFNANMAGWRGSRRATR